MPTPLSGSVLGALRGLIAARCGILFPENKTAQLEARLADHVQECGYSGFTEYVRALEASDANSPLWQAVYHRVCTNETYFFRNTAQARAFQDFMLPEVIRAQEGRLFRRLKIWSAACASGEEPYTLAMQVLATLGDKAAELQTAILATDIDSEALREAAAGVYGGRAIQNVPQTHLATYFDVRGDTYTVRDKVKSLITFRFLNFADNAQMSAQTNMDIIFCRNVLIYFDADFRRRVVEHLYNALKPGGFLVIGHSESLRGIHEGFRTINCPGTLVYQRPGA